MTKYILASATALSLIIAPIAAMAQGNAGTGTSSSSEMKGPPNADGMTKDGMTKKDGTDGMTTGRSEDSAGGSNGAASAKSTGADKQ